MNTLKKDSFIQVSGIIFLAVAILHGLRVVNNWELVYHEWMVPMWISWAVVVVVLYLAYSAFRLKKQFLLYTQSEINMLYIIISSFQKTRQPSWRVFCVTWKPGFQVGFPDCSQIDRIIYTLYIFIYFQHIGNTFLLIG